MRTAMFISQPSFTTQCPGRVGLVLTILCSFPLLTHPCRDAFLEILEKIHNLCCAKIIDDDDNIFVWLREAFFGRVIMSIFLCCVAMTVAVIVDDVVVIWSFAGSTVAIIIAYFLPALFYLKLRRGPICRDRHKIYAFIILVGSIIACVLCTYEAVTNLACKAGNGIGGDAKPNSVHAH